MKAVLGAKFAHPDMRQLLLKTGNAFLLEHNDRAGRIRCGVAKCVVQVVLLRVF